MAEYRTEHIEIKTKISFQVTNVLYYKQYFIT